MSLFRWIVPVCPHQGEFAGPSWSKPPLPLSSAVLVFMWGVWFYDIRSIDFSDPAFIQIMEGSPGILHVPNNITFSVYFPFAGVWICSSVRLARQNKSPFFTPFPLKHIRDVFRLFRISSSHIIVILCFPQTLKNDFMLIAVWSKENGKRSDFPLDNKHPIFPGSVCREHRYDRTVSWASHHWSLLMQTVSGAFFHQERQRVWAPSPPLTRQPGCLLVEEATWSKFGGVVYAKAITLCLGSLPSELDCSAATELFSPEICHPMYTNCHM